MSDWVKCSERLPKIRYHLGKNSICPYDEVLLCTIKGEVLIGQLECWNDESHLRWVANDTYVNGYEYDRSEWELEQVTHWMPLPELPPKEEDESK